MTVPLFNTTSDQSMKIKIIWNISSHLAGWLEIHRNKTLPQS
jgi:hypothetical protein